MKTNISAGRSGQVLPGAVAILVILSVMVPAIVLWVQREGIATIKQSRDTVAFHMAEAGTEKAYLYVSLSTITWNSIQAGNSQPNYRFDKAFTDIPGGSYAISITSGPATQQVTIVSIGRDASNRETRALRVVYTNAILGDTAIFAGGGVLVGGGLDVEWGAVMSPSNIEATGRDYPKYLSSSRINDMDIDADPPNTDGCQYWAFQKSLPTPPDINFDFYRTSAAATTGCPNYNNAQGTALGALRDGTLSPGSCYYPGSVTGWDQTTAGKTIFIEGNLSIDTPGMFHTGTIIVMGNVILPTGAWGKGNVTMSMPSKAWKQYCNDWGHYQTFDGGAPAAFPGVNSTLDRPGITKNSNKVAVNGFMYVGGNFNPAGGGGASDVYGVLYSIGTSSFSSSSTIDFYYNGNAAQNIVTTNISLSRTSWQDEVRGWPSGL